MIRRRAPLGVSYVAGTPARAYDPTIVEILAIILGATAIVLTVVIEALKRPRLQLKPNEWRPRGPVAWTFAEAYVRVRPLPRFLQAVLVRDSAANCTATIRFQNGTQTLRTIDGRWSGRPEPIKREIVQSPTTKLPEVREVFVPEVVPQTKTVDLVPGRWEAVAVAVLRQDGTASMFGAESYAGGPDGGIPVGIFHTASTRWS